MNEITNLPEDTSLVFYGHFGQRSQAAAEYFRLQDSSKVCRLVGGIDARAREVDPGVPRY